MRNSIILYLVIIFFLSLLSGLLFNRSTEGFYSNTSTSNAKSTINDLLTNQITSLRDVLKDMGSNKHNIDLAPAISSLSDEMKNSSNSTRNYIKNRKDELSNIQKNLNRINDRITKFSTETKVDQYIIPSDPKSIQSIPIMDAIEKVNNNLKRISEQLSEIPE